MQLALQAPAAATPTRQRDAVAVAALLVVTFLAHAASPVTTSTDSAWTFHVSASILQEGDIDLDEYRQLMDLDVDYRLRSVGSHIYSYYPPATPALTTPMVLIANAVLPWSRGEDFFAYLRTHTPDERTARLEKLTASIFVAISAALMYLVARRYTDVVKSALAASILVFGTSMWSTASRALWQHGPSAMLLLGGLYISVAYPAKRWSVLAVGAVLSFAYIVRPTNSLTFAFFGLYYLINHGRLAWNYVQAGTVVLLPYAVINWFTYGNLLPPYSYQLFERIGTPASIGEALAGTLISPSRGIFVFTPVLLFALHGAFLSMKRPVQPATNLVTYVLAILISHWIMTALFVDWGGAWSIGPRYFVEVLPFFVFLLLPFLAAWPDWLPAARYGFIVALAVSVLIQLRCSTSAYPFIWNGKPKSIVEAPGRVWDWGDVQFLRGLCRQDPLEGRAPACWLASDE